VDAETKRCPDCDEVIRAAARRCRFCGRRFAPPGDAPPPTPADAVAPEELLELLAGLVSRSLVVHDPVSGRYRLLETVRQYARERLMESGGADSARARHLAFFLEMAESAAPELQGPRQGEHLRLLAEEHGNLNAAFSFALSSAGSEWAPLRLVNALWRYWRTRGFVSEGRNLAEAALRSAPDAPVRLVAYGHNTAGILSDFLGDYAAASEHYARALDLFRQEGDPRGEAHILSNLGILARKRGNLPEARRLQEEAVAIKRTLGDRPFLASSLNNVGIVAANQGDHAAARSFLEEALAIMREAGDVFGIALALENLGDIDLAEERLDAAAARYDEALPLLESLGDRHFLAVALTQTAFLALARGRPDQALEPAERALRIRQELSDRRGLAESWEAIAEIAAACGRHDLACRLLGAAAALRESIGSRTITAARVAGEHVLAQAEAALGTDAVRSAWDEGLLLRPDQAAQLALQHLAALRSGTDGSPA